MSRHLFARDSEDEEEGRTKDPSKPYLLFEPLDRVLAREAQERRALEHQPDDDISVGDHIEKTPHSNQEANMAGENEEQYDPDIPANLIAEWGNQIADAQRMASQRAVVHEGEGGVVRSQAEAMHTEASRQYAMGEGQHAAAGRLNLHAQTLDRQGDRTADPEQAAALHAEASRDREMAAQYESSADRFDARAADAQARGDELESEANRHELEAKGDEQLSMALSKGLDSIGHDVGEIGDLLPGTVSQVANLLDRIDSLPSPDASAPDPEDLSDWSPPDLDPDITDSIEDDFDPSGGGADRGQDDSDPSGGGADRGQGDSDPSGGGAEGGQDDFDPSGGGANRGQDDFDPSGGGANRGQDDFDPSGGGAEGGQDDFDPSRGGADRGQDDLDPSGGGQDSADSYGSDSYGNGYDTSTGGYDGSDQISSGSW